MNRRLPGAVLAGLALAACSGPRDTAEPVRPVLATVVAPGAASTREVYSGELRARVETDLAFRIGGKIAARLADAGNRVTRGQALARLDPRDAALAADAARAQLATAQAEHALAQAEYERATDLLARRFISQSAHDAREAAFSASRARVEQARSQAAISANQEAYTTLVADADGVVVSVSAEPGQVVAAGQSVLRLARDGEMEVVIDAPESQVARLRPGQEVAIFLWADPGRRFPGRVREIAGGADPVTRTFKVRVSAAKTPPGARVGMSASVALRASDDATLVVVPLAALLRAPNGAAVWVVDPKTSRVKRRKVELGEYREDGATILGGLAAGETVVTAGVHKLREDQPVRLADAPSAR
ncbi:MAG: efflux RND transporter periplasmic adaptor subunit [Burkholderiales bacterium]